MWDDVTGIGAGLDDDGAAGCGEGEDGVVYGYAEAGIECLTCYDECGTGGCGGVGCTAERPDGLGCGNCCDGSVIVAIVSCLGSLHYDRVP